MDIITIMKTEEILQIYNPWWERKYSKKGIKRKKYLSFLEENLKNDRIIILTGLRRVGKTTILLHFIEEILKKTDAKHILYLSLDHPELSNHSIGEMMDTHRKIHGLSRKKKLFVFLDEVLYTKNAVAWLKTLHDSQNIKIFATSSQSLHLKDEKAYLTGRHKTIEVMPLDFSEFLLFKDTKILPSESYLLDKYFEDYMKMGGMPEYVLKGDAQIIVHLVDDIITKDIMVKHKLKDKQKLQELFSLLCERAGKRMTYSKLSRILRVKEETLSSYISYFVDSHLIHIVYKSARTLNERITSPKKMYLNDVGIRNVFSGFKDKGAIFENLVFLKIRENDPRYLEEKGVELDFVYKDRIIECKYGGISNEEQEKLMEKHRKKYKIMVAEGSKFFIQIKR